MELYDIIPIMVGDLDSMTHFPSYTKRDAFNAATFYLIHIPSKFSKNLKLFPCHNAYRLEKKKPTYLIFFLCIAHDSSEKQLQKSITDMFHKKVVPNETFSHYIIIKLPEYNVLLNYDLPQLLRTWKFSRNHPKALRSRKRTRHKLT